VQCAVFPVYSPQSRRSQDSLVLVIGEDIVDFGMVVFACDRVFDERKERFEVGWRCWRGGIGCGLVGAGVPGGEAGC
jgi:hypothetical protein